MKITLSAAGGVRWCFLACLLVLLPRPASAADCGGGLNPIVIIPTPVVFGLYSPGAANAAILNGTIIMSCTVVLTTLPSFTIGLSKGSYGQFTARQMAFGSARLNYNLYTSASYGTIWGDGVGGISATQAYSAGGVTTTYTVYGRVPTNQFVTTGAYMDSITITVTY